MQKNMTFSQDYVIRETDFPSQKIHGMVLLDEEGRANIYLKKSDPDERKLRTVKHETLHYIRNDFDREDRDAMEAEVEALTDKCNIVMLEDCDAYMIEGPDEESV